MNQKSILPISIVLLPLMATTFLTSCFSRSVEWDLNEVAYQYKVRNLIPPESKWNHAKAWKRVGSNPAVYVPSGYPRGGSLSDSKGQWVVDERDGKRFFIPYQGADNTSASLLKKDALKNSRPFKATPNIY